MKIMLVISIAIIIFAAINYDKMSYKAWYYRNKDRNDGYYWGGIPRNKSESMQIGDYVETIHGVNGILTEIRKDSYHGDVAFIATSDMRTFYCPVSDIKSYAIKKKNNECNNQ